MCCQNPSVSVCNDEPQLPPSRQSPRPRITRPAFRQKSCAARPAACPAARRKLKSPFAAPAERRQRLSRLQGRPASPFPQGRRRLRQYAATGPVRPAGAVRNRHASCALMLSLYTIIVYKKSISAVSRQELPVARRPCFVYNRKEHHRKRGAML